MIDMMEQALLIEKKLKLLNNLMRIMEYYTPFFYCYNYNIMNSNDRNVVFITDVNQVKYALTNAYMILEQTSSKVVVNIIMIDIENYDELNSIIKEKNLDINLVRISSKDFELGKSKIEHITNATNARLYLSSILPHLDNVLYLDNDIVVDGDVNELFDFVNPEKFYGRPWNRKDWWPRILKIKGMLKNKYYMNAGVLFLNLKFIRENLLEEQFTKFLLEKKINFADQDVLNCNLKFETLPHTWNIAREKWEQTNSDVANKSELKIYHFLSKNKQWNDDIDIYSYKKRKGDLKLSEYLKMIEPQKKWKKYYNDLITKENI